MYYKYLYVGLPGALFSPSSKSKKTFTLKNVLSFSLTKIEVACPKIKKLSHICQKILSFNSRNEAFLKKLLIFQEGTFRHLKSKKKLL